MVRTSVLVFDDYITLLNGGKLPPNYSVEKLMQPHESQEMSLVLSLVERTIKRDLAAMQKMGVLLREGNTSAGHWVIIDRTEK